jgi:hypothetical protein
VQIGLKLAQHRDFGLLHPVAGGILSTPIFFLIELKNAEKK